MLAWTNLLRNHTLLRISSRSLTALRSHRVYVILESVHDGFPVPMRALACDFFEAPVKAAEVHKSTFVTYFFQIQVVPDK